MMSDDDHFAGRVQLIEDLDELLLLWHELDGNASIPVYADGLGAGLAIHNIVEHVTSLSEAIRSLVSQDISLPIAPLIRLSLECAVTAAWWAADPVSRVGLSVAEEARQKKLLAEDLVRTATPDDDYSDVKEALTARTAELGPPSNQAKLFKDRCDATPGFEWAYGMYRMLSAASHAGTALVAEYLDQTSPRSDNLEGLTISQRPTWSAQVIGRELQPVLLTIALAVYNSTLPQTPLLARLTSFSERHGFHDIVEAVIAGISPKDYQTQSTSPKRPPIVANRDRKSQSGE